MRPSFFHHLHPPTIPAQQARLRYTLGLGGISVFLVLVLILTGTLEMFFYIPTPDEAGLSIQSLTYLVPFGWLVRNLHYWAAQLLVVASLLHLLRVLLTGSYSAPRRLNYLIGLALLALILFLDFSGYILRWDEGVRWALIAGTNLLKTIPLLGAGLYRLVMGGDQPGAASLIRFYTWHIFGLTLILISVGVWHLFRVRRDGGIAVPPPSLRSKPERISRNVLVRRELLAALIALIILLGFSLFLPAPIAQPMEFESMAATDSAAPWFFLWVQQLLRWGDPFILGVLVPLVFLLGLGSVPYLFKNINPRDLGRWLPTSGRSVQVLALLLTLVLISLTVAALMIKA